MTKATPPAMGDNDGCYDDLSHVLNPSLLDEVYRSRFPYDIVQPLKVQEVATLLLREDPTLPVFYDLCFPTLLELSRHSLDRIPPLITHLPPATDDTFPSQALGLVLLLDQAPRLLFKGIDKRWSASFFDPIALQLAKDLQALPWGSRPDNPARWPSLHFPHILLRSMTFHFPLHHSEDYADHMLCHGLDESLRREVERRWNVRDPSRDTDRADAADVYAFASLAPSASDLSLEFEHVKEFFFLFFRILRVHEPIIRVYGRYPYRNGAYGRDPTGEELEYMVRTNGTFAVDKDTARAIREDVDAGRWTPLKGGRPS
ncbi:hypothetical protein HKX48_004594 [Thoreauomyces humboldtii]|nr:hypothetical protein HKX48_004594 [Thoreauomyces humboldtii]